MFLGLIFNEGYGMQVSFTNKTHINGDVDLEWGQKHVNNFLDLQFRNNVTHFLYKLQSPKTNKSIFNTNVTYKKTSEYHNIT